MDIAEAVYPSLHWERNLLWSYSPPHPSPSGDLALCWNKPVNLRIMTVLYVFSVVYAILFATWMHVYKSEWRHLSDVWRGWGTLFTFIVQSVSDLASQPCPTLWGCRVAVLLRPACSSNLPASTEGIVSGTGRCVPPWALHSGRSDDAAYVNVT